MTIHENCTVHNWFLQHLPLCVPVTWQWIVQSRNWKYFRSTRSKRFWCLMCNALLGELLIILFLLDQFTGRLPDVSMQCTYILYSQSNEFCCKLKDPLNINLHSLKTIHRQHFSVVYVPLCWIININNYR